MAPTGSLPAALRPITATPEAHVSPCPSTRCTGGPSAWPQMHVHGQGCDQPTPPYQHRHAAPARGGPLPGTFCGGVEVSRGSAAAGGIGQPEIATDHLSRGFARAGARLTAHLFVRDVGPARPGGSAWAAPAPRPRDRRRHVVSLLVEGARASGAGAGRPGDAVRAAVGPARLLAANTGQRGCAGRAAARGAVGDRAARGRVVSARSAARHRRVLRPDSVRPFHSVV